jgi:hypothetical protein
MEITGNKSLPSTFGHLTESLFDQYPVYELKFSSSSIINEYLPDKLAAFSIKSWKNRSKHHFFYSKPIIYATRCQLSNTNEPLSSTFSFSDLLKELLSENNSKLRYNFVIMGDRIILARVAPLHHLSYRLLCKHISLANRSADVRFAGELWRDEKHQFRLNNNSGTYRPVNELIKQATQLLNLLTSLQFEGIDFRKSIPFPVKHQRNKKIRST